MIRRGYISITETLLVTGVLTIACTPPGAGTTETGSSPDTDGTPGESSGAAGSDGGADGSGGGGPGEGGGPAGDGLPCDVDAILAASCRSCHGVTPLGNMISLLSRADLLADSPTVPNATIGQRAVSRMQDATTPMPPAPALPVAESDIAVVADWVAAGMPAGDCTTDPAPSPFDAESMCTSNRMWQGCGESDRMKPGEACIDCHNNGDNSGDCEDDNGPFFLLAGTVYPTGHEPDSCYGFAGAVVEVTDASRQTLKLSTNEAGNFYLEAEDAPPGFAAPYYVKVVYDGKELAMATEVTDGDCNTCHTADGDQDAPGRIVLPWQ